MKVIVELADDEVLVALKRVEGYEDVHPELLTDDAIGEGWPEWRTIHGDQVVPANATKLTCRRSSEAAEGTLPAQPVKRSGSARLLDDMSGEHKWD